MFKPVSSLIKAGLLSPRALILLLRALSLHGLNLMTVLQFSAFRNPNRIAIDDGKRKLGYKELLSKSMGLAQEFDINYGLKPGDKVALICRNHVFFVAALSALSRLGVDSYLISTELSESQLTSLLNKNDFKLIIADDEQGDKLISLSKQVVFISSIVVTENQTQRFRLKKAAAANIVVFSSGTGGSLKTAERKPSATNYLSPFLAVLSDLQLYKFGSVYIATPIYHGFALAALIISVLLSSTVYLREYFDADAAAEMIYKNEIEVVSLVPLMLQRMLGQPEKLKSLKVIISGSAPLSKDLILQTSEKLGDILANLYGTSEAGFCIMATKDDLIKEPKSIGRALRGVGVKVVGEDGHGLEPKQIGLLFTKAKWSMSSKKSRWIKTGDLAYIDRQGYVFLQGREDDMIVSGGENVYPIILEKSLKSHQAIKDVQIVAVNDLEFGKRLKAVVVLKPNRQVSEESLRAFLKDRLARYQMPREIVFVSKIDAEKSKYSDKLI